MFSLPHHGGTPVVIFVNPDCSSSIIVRHSRSSAIDCRRFFFWKATVYQTYFIYYFSRPRINGNFPPLNKRYIHIKLKSNRKTFRSKGEVFGGDQFPGMTENRVFCIQVSYGSLKSLFFANYGLRIRF